MTWTTVAMIALAAVSRPGMLHGQAQVDSLLRFPPSSPMAELARAFRGGDSPVARNVVGEWRATSRVITGWPGPDRVYADSTILKFRPAPNDGLEAWYAPVHQWAAVKRNDSGDLVFLSDDSADVALFWSCRAIGATRLVCFDLDHLGGGAADAIAFERM